MTQEYLHSILNYDEHTGELTWRSTKQGRRGTLEAGHKRKKDKYIRVTIDRKLYYAHRLAWLHFYGVYPKKYLDHKDRNPQNNSITNLREATHSENMKNRKRQKHNTSGQSGVAYRKDNGKWRASINHVGKRINLGTFTTKEEAIAERIKYEKIYNY